MNKTVIAISGISKQGKSHSIKEIASRIKIHIPAALVTYDIKLTHIRNGRFLYQKEIFQCCRWRYV
jgi:hypothetical protein